MKTLFITGGAGFIGSHFLNTFVPLHREIFFVNLDSLTYAGDLSHIETSVQGSTNYIFEKVDIREKKLLETLYEKYAPSGTIHFAAESHVDRSIASADIFLETNIFGTKNLLDCHQKYGSGRFHYVSTDEVYGDIPGNHLSKETDILNPSSPYSASKAGAEMLVMSYGRTYGVDYTISRGSNTYGIHQHTEKLIPYALQQLKEGKKIGLYGDGENIRDWLSVDDHARAIWEIFVRGKSTNIYNVGARNLKTNNELIGNIFTYLKKDDLSLEYVIDRLGHDRRYALDTSKIREELDWVAKANFEEELSSIIQYHFPMTLKTYITSLSGVLILESPIFSDSRGKFQELYREDFFQLSGIDTIFVQDNFSVSKKGVLRGLHFQTQKPQAKLVIPLSGSIYDVVVDLRQDSPTFGKYEGYILYSGKSLFVPRGFAHGFLSLEDDTTVLYKCDTFYDPSGESGIMWNDESLGIDWKNISKDHHIEDLILSEKDSRLPSFLTYKNNPLL